MQGPVALSRRLSVVADLVGQTSCLVDVGCDHGKLSVYCLQSGQARRVIAIDVSAPSLDKARQLAEACEVTLDLRRGNGLEPLDAGEDIDTVVIAGMGGMEIIRILSMAVLIPPRVVLMPHRDGDLVVRYLTLAGYSIEHDFVLADDDRWYRAISADSDGVTRPLGYDWQRKIDQSLPLEGDWYVGGENRYNNDYATYRTLRMRRLQQIFRQGGGSPRLLAEWHNLERIEHESY